jgi:outer membrane receptor protein involved in Fe transport
MPKVFRFTLIALAIFALAVPSGFAQVSRTTGALQGTVTDNTGAPLPGVTVTVSGPTLQGSRSEVTDAKGEYILPLLPPGDYHVEYSLQGIPTVKKDRVTVSLNTVSRVNVPMTLTVSETVTVTASQVVIDPTQTTQQQNFKQDHLKYAVIGSANRSYQNVLQQAAGVAGGSNPQVVGANNAQNNYMLDGINTTDPVTHTFGNNLAFDAIQEISIQTLGKSAEYSSSGGTVNVITKSGGNNFSGSFDWRYNNKSLQTQGQDKHPTGIAFFGATPTGSALNFDKNLQPVKNSNPQMTLGGPVMRDRLWFFAALARPDTATTPPSTQGFTPGTRTFKGWNNLGKATFTPKANQTITALFIDSYAKVANANNSSFYSPEADALQTQGSRTYGVTYDAILNSKWLANVQGGHTPARLAVIPNSGTAIGFVNNLTSVRTGNYNNAQGRTSNRDELVANTTYYMERFGTHAFKVGVNYNKTDFSSYNNSSGDPSTLAGWNPAFCSPQYGFPTGTECSGYVITQGTIFQLQLSPKNPPHEVASKQYAYFLQDEWNPITQLTIRAGLRYEQVKWDNPVGNNPPDFKKLQPRLGVAYDIFNNASSVVHGYVGRIMDDNQLTLPNFGYEQPSGTQSFRRNAAGVFTYVGGAIFSSGAVYDSNLKPSFSNQASLGFTQKIWRNTSLDVTYETRNQKNLFEDYCGHIDADGTQHDLDNCVITNTPGFDVGVKDSLRSDYHGIITKVESRPYQWLDFVASWTHAKSKGSTESTQNAAASFDYFPVFFTNTYGYLSDDARNRIKIDGYARLPWDFTLGMNYYWDDGTPWSVTQTNTAPAATGFAFPPGYSGVGTYFIEPRGSRRLPSFSSTDFQLQKDFRFSSVKVGLIGSVFNIFNSETVTARQGNAGVNAKADPATGKLLISGDQQTGLNRLSAAFGQPTSWQRPRRYEVGLRFEF